MLHKLVSAKAAVLSLDNFVVEFLETRSSDQLRRLVLPFLALLNYLVSFYCVSHLVELSGEGVSQELAFLEHLGQNSGVKHPHRHPRVQTRNQNGVALFEVFGVVREEELLQKLHHLLVFQSYEVSEGGVF